MTMDEEVSSDQPRSLRDLLRLTLTPDLGPVLIARLLEHFGTAATVLGKSSSALAAVRGIGSVKADAIARGLAASDELATTEIEACEQLGVRLISLADNEYPALLKTIPSAPPLLYIKGTLEPATLDQYPCAIVGSRNCTAYGIEQAERFGGFLGRSGITIVSGGAYGIDAAAHRGALRAQGRTIAVLGCGLAKCYPPEHKELFEEIAQHGAVVSELPLDTSPNPANFPARNRIISGMSLGVVVIEAQRRSGALITARLAAEDHAREVFALPGRVDSAASEGSLDLIKQGGAIMVTEPADVLAALESPARHHHEGTHEARYQADDPVMQAVLFDPQAGETQRTTHAPKAPSVPRIGVTPAQQAILDALSSSLTLDQLQSQTGRPVSELRGDLTVLEIQKMVVREGSVFRTRR